MDILLIYSIVIKALLIGCVLGVAYTAWLIIQKARAQNRRPVGDEEEVFINIALCETRFGICTHYHDIGVKLLKYGGYPINGYPTLCGAEVGWDVRNQDAEATCETCREALAKMAKESNES